MTRHGDPSPVEQTPATTPPRTQIAIAVVAWEEQFVIGQRPAGVSLAGLWEFPGGKFEPRDGKLVETARRECREETGLEFVVEQFGPVVVHAYTHAVVELHFFHGRPLDPAAPLIAPFRWVHRRELSQYEFPPANRQLVNELLG